MHPLIVVLYDGVENSVFQGQVLAPLQQHAAAHPDQEIHIISFERKPPNQSLRTTIPFPVHVIPRLPFLGILSLMHSARKLKHVLSSFHHYELLARGPLAGFVCLRIINPARCVSLTIQARGLLAEEYAYAHPASRNPLSRLWHTRRKRSLRSIEQSVYSRSSYPVPTTIEAVSDALKRHLMTTHMTPDDRITIATKDIPKPISDRQRAVWRAEIRQKFSIHPDAPVFCYNGSVKAWQCPEMTVSFFKLELTKNPASILLIVTRDRRPFITLLAKEGIDPKSYRIVTSDHQDVYRYLAASDVGIIFRHHSLINWVARPTKVLEYRAVGLHIVHNNTVGILTQQR